jgi:hypothetical protein
VGTVSLSADTGTSSSDLSTYTAAQTISATLSSALDTDDILYGSIDNGANWTDITSKASGTAITWDGVTLSGSSSIVFKVTDLAGNGKDVCKQEAKAVEKKALADAKMGQEISDAKKDAASDKLEADYKVALEKCNALAGDTKTSCVAAAKVSFGKN